MVWDDRCSARHCSNVATNCISSEAQQIREIIKIGVASFPKPYFLSFHPVQKHLEDRGPHIVDDTRTAHHRHSRQSILVILGERTMRSRLCHDDEPKG